jgi:hypothetical protein
MGEERKRKAGRVARLLSLFKNKLNGFSHPSTQQFIITGSHYSKTGQTFSVHYKRIFTHGNLDHERREREREGEKDKERKRKSKRERERIRERERLEREKEGEFETIFRPVGVV